MFTVELYAKVRHAVMIEGLSRREAAKRFGIHRNTITKMLSFSVPPGYRRRERPASRKLGPFMAWIDAILESDRSVHKKQRHTAHRIFERLRDEQGFTGGYTIVREYVAAAMLRTREMFVPLSHRPGHAQADFGEADGYIGGKKVRFHYFCVDLPHSDGCFVKAYPAETAKAIGSPPARRHSGDRLRGKAKTRKRKAKETPPPKYKSARKHENKPGFTALFS
jgi:transposase